MNDWLEQGYTQDPRRAMIDTLTLYTKAELEQELVRIVRNRPLTYVIMRNEKDIPIEELSRKYALRRLEAKDLFTF